MLETLKNTKQIIKASKALKESEILDWHDTSIFAQIYKKTQDFESRFLLNRVKNPKG